MVPLAKNTALGIAIMSYNGQLNFGLTADFDAMPISRRSPRSSRSSIEELAAIASAPTDDRTGRAEPDAGFHADGRRRPQRAGITA